MTQRSYIKTAAAPVVEESNDAGTALDDPGVDKDALARLMTTGELLLIRDNAAGKGQMITGGIRIDRPVETVYGTITDYTHYTQFMPSTEECEVLATNGAVQDIRYVIKFKFLIFSWSVEYVWRHIFKPCQEITWRLLSSKGGKIREVIGSWRLYPIDDGRRTAAFYSIYSDISNVVPGLSKYLARDTSLEAAVNLSACIMVLRAVKQRTENPAWRQTK
jgi:ribosome-associated toxin RatA of RatAB toxin-antitoxin module